MSVGLFCDLCGLKSQSTAAVHCCTNCARMLQTSSGAASRIVELEAALRDEREQGHALRRAASFASQNERSAQDLIARLERQVAELTEENTQLTDSANELIAAVED